MLCTFPYYVMKWAVKSKSEMYFILFSKVMKISELNEIDLPNEYNKFGFTGRKKN